jgi:DNA-directed RNA polymerase subunit RPC12/RpoP
MANIDVKCWDCGKTTTVSDKFAGKKGKCPVCGKIIQIPDTKNQPDMSYDINIDVAPDEVKKVAQQIAAGTGAKKEKKQGFLGKLFGKK